MSLPTISGVGRLCADPELRFTPQGKAVAKLRLAFSSRRRNPQTQEWEDGDSCFLDATVWEQAAENCAESFQCGTEVMVTGRLKQRQYETREGEKRTVFELLVDAIGPSVRYATAKVAKMSRQSEGGSRFAQTGDAPDPWATPAPAPATAGKGGGFDDEPPF